MMSCLASSFLAASATSLSFARNVTGSSSAVATTTTTTSTSSKFSFTVEAAHKKGTGSVKNGRDSNPKYRGVKLYGQEKCRAGNIIVRQLGNKFHAGPGVGTGKDFTLFALRDGEILFKKGAGKKQFVCVVDAVERAAATSRKTKRRELYTPRASAAVESR